jgi:class 3 adenylate cyclase
MTSKNLSVMVTDLLGYSSKSASASRAELRSLVQTHNRLLKPVIEYYRGKIIKSLGDSFLCTFDSATDASICAIAIQIITREYNQRSREKDGSGSLTVRVAIATGDVMLENSDIYGPAVNLAARMEKLPEIAEGGIALNEATYLLVNQQEIHAELVGEREFKGVGSTKVFRLDLSKQKLDQLPTRLLELVERVAEGKDISAQPEPWAKKRTAIVSFSILACVLAVFMVLHDSRHDPTPEEHEVLGYVQVAFMKNGPRIEEKDWTGPKEAFREIASESKVITPVEIQRWADKKGIRLPPPPR